MQVAKVLTAWGQLVYKVHQSRRRTAKISFIVTEPQKLHPCKWVVISFMGISGASHLTNHFGQLNCLVISTFFMSIWYWRKSDFIWSKKNITDHSSLYNMQILCLRNTFLVTHSWTLLSAKCNFTVFWVSSLFARSHFVSMVCFGIWTNRENTISATPWLSVLELIVFRCLRWIKQAFPVVTVRTIRCSTIQKVFLDLQELQCIFWLVSFSSQSTVPPPENSGAQLTLKSASAKTILDCKSDFHTSTKMNFHMKVPSDILRIRFGRFLYIITPELNSCSVILRCCMLIWDGIYD